MEKNPLPYINTTPLEGNILEWHFVIEGPADSLYRGGLYHGALSFPSDYPLKPPGIRMFTPNGRFSINQRLCLSMSDFHPETWNPHWGPSQILMGLFSFMLEPLSSSYGSISTSDLVKRKFAQESLDYNCRNQQFLELFPQYAQLYEDLRKSREVSRTGAGRGTMGNVNGSSATNVCHKSDEPLGVSWAVIGAMLAIILSSSYLMISMSM